MIIWQSKKTLSVTLAVLLGVSIILFAWKNGTSSSVKNSTDEGVWMDSLRVVPQETSSKNRISGQTQETNPAKDQSLTGAIAEDFMISYTNTKGSGSSTSPMTDKEAEAFAENLLKKHSAIPVKQYTEKDLVVVEVSTSTVTTYKKEVATTMGVFLGNKPFDELSAVSRALNTRDSTELEPLSVAVSNYQGLIDTLLLIKVPKTAVNFHLYIIQSYATILSGLVDLQSILTDPVRGSQGFAKYNSGADMVLQTGTLFK